MSFLKKNVNLWIKLRQESFKNPQINAEMFTNGQFVNYCNYIGLCLEDVKYLLDSDNQMFGILEIQLRCWSAQFLTAGSAGNIFKGKSYPLYPMFYPFIAEITGL